MKRFNKKEKERLLGIEPKYLLENGFALNMFDITVSVNGNIVQSYYLKRGENITISVQAPDLTNNILDSILDNNVALIPTFDGTNYIFDLINIQSKHQIVATFKKKTDYLETKTATAAGATISAAGTCGSQTPTGGSFSKTFGLINIPDDAEIYNVECVANGSVSQACPSSYTSFSMHVNSYSNGNWGGTLPTGSSWSPSDFTNKWVIYGSCHREEPFICCNNTAYGYFNGATLTVQYYSHSFHNISVEKTGNGTISDGVILYNNGYNYLFSAQPDEGYHISSVTLDGNTITLSEDGTYLLSNITTDHAFEVTFEQNS